MTLRPGYKNVIIFLLPLFSFFVLPANWIEYLYGGFIYPFLRWIFLLVTWLPIPLFYVLIISVVMWIILLVTSKTKWSDKLFKLVIGIGFMILLFYFLWAFNYRRPDFDSRINYVEEPMDSIAWQEELNFALNQLKSTRPGMFSDWTSQTVQNLIRDSLTRVCATFGYKTNAKIGIKSLYPKGLLLRIKTAGFYLPYAGEGYIDPGLHPIQKAYTIAHEMAHGYGVTDEGACNFLAYVVTCNHKDSSIHYSGAMAYFRYVAAEYRARFPIQYKQFRDSLPQPILRDLEDIYQQMIKYPDILPKMRDKMYNHYLTIQGVKDGLSSYDHVIGYVRTQRLNSIYKQ